MIKIVTNGIEKYQENDKNKIITATVMEEITTEGYNAGKNV